MSRYLGPSRQCIVCSRMLLREWFRGGDAQCRVCQNRLARQYRAANPTPSTSPARIRKARLLEQALAAGAARDTLAWCKPCSAWLDRSRFTPHGITVYRCAACNSAAANAWGKANRDKVNARERAMGEVRRKQKRDSRAKRRAEDPVRVERDRANARAAAARRRAAGGR